MKWGFGASRAHEPRPVLESILADFSVEVTSRDAEKAVGRVAPGTEVFVANLPKDGSEALIAACARLRQAGLQPVPHIVARKLTSERELDALLERLAGEAAVERVLSLGGDRDTSKGPFSESLQLIESGAFERHGIRHVSIACYPEGHPRIDDPTLLKALHAKSAAIADRGMEARLVSQLVFEGEPVIAFARSIREAGIQAPLRVGVAGPASAPSLLKYAMRCGVGPSLRALTGRAGLATNLLSAVTPEAVLARVAEANAGDPALRIEGVHFFTFGDPAGSIEWAAANGG